MFLSFFVLLGPCGLQLAHDSKYCVMFPVVVSHGLGGVKEFKRELAIFATKSSRRFGPSD